MTAGRHPNQVPNRCSGIRAEAHPEFNGQTAVVAAPYQGIYVYGPQDARSRLMTDLGFTFPQDLSIPLLVDELVPKLAAAADGDPKTQ